MHEILKELCIELLQEGLSSPRFTELWLESGIVLEDDTFEIANFILGKSGSFEGEELYPQSLFLQ